MRGGSKRGAYCDGADLGAYAEGTRISGMLLAGLQPAPPNRKKCQMEPNYAGCREMAHPRADVDAAPATAPAARVLLKLRL